MAQSHAYCIHTRTQLQRSSIALEEEVLMEMDQIEEFDSTSSSSAASSASESSSNESSGEEEGDSSCEAGEGDVSDSQEDDSSGIGLAMTGGIGSSVAHGSRSYQTESLEAEGGRRRKRLRKRKATGLRKKLRTHIESVDEFNPEARSAQSAELERLRRLQLQQSLTSSIDQTPPKALVAAPSTYAEQIQPQAISSMNVPSQQMYMSPMQEASAGPSQTQVSSVQGVSPPGDAVSVARPRSDSSSSPEVLMVDLTRTAKMGDAQRRVEDAIVIDSGSDSDHTNNVSNEQGRPQVIAKQQSGGVVAAVVPTTTQFCSGDAAVAMPTPSELLNMKYGEILPSPDGRVLVNAGHASSEEDIYLAPQIARTIKPHQVGGIRFLYDNIVESLTRFNSSPGFGCILAHSMGLGKTLQVIGFIEVFFRCTTAKHVLCVVPVNTLQNWIGEFEHWIPPPPSSSAQPNPNRSSTSAALLTNQNPLWSQMTTLATNTTPLVTLTSSKVGSQSRTDEIHYRTFNISILSEANRTMDSRLKVIREWTRVGGVLLLGYEMYRLLSLSVPSLGGNKMAVKKKKKNQKAPDGGTIDLDETEREMDALIEIQKALCNPGPDLVVCDEGHRIKNDYSNISQALKRIRTRRRIVMTGYPLQNNLTEYWCMVDFVRPNLLGTKQEFADLFERPITNGQCMDSTPMDVRLMRYRSHVLHSLLEGFILRRGHEILKTTLPPKFEHVLYLRPSQVQGDLYNYNMSAIAQAGGSANTAGPLKAFAVCSKIWNHPDIYYQEAMTQRSKMVSPTAWLDQEGLPKTLLSAGPSSGGAAKGSSSNESTCKIEWPSSDIPNYRPGVLENSPKMVVLVELVDRSVQLGDKILIFSQSLNTLSYIEKLLSRRHIPVPNSTDPTGAIQYSNVKWAKNKNYCRLDGSTNSIERDRLINSFNSANNQECWVFLLSTKAGCLGINLIGANRVIVTDVSWNPCYDSQAVCRVYRYGQTKPCYIYRLVCDGTMERKIYDRQISKQSMSNRVVDELHPERHLTTQDILKLITPLAQLPPPSDLSPHAMEYLFDPLLMEICSSHGHLLTKLPFKHESLLIDSEEERMTEVEKYLAMKGFQQHLKLLRSNPNNQPSGQGGYRPQAGQTGTLRPQPSQVRPQGSQARPQTGQTRLQTGQTGQARPTHGQQGRPYPQIAGLQVPIPPVPEATPSTSGLMKRGSVAAAPVIRDPNEKVEVICLDSDDDDNGDSRPVALTRGGEIPSITGAVVNDPVSLLQSPTHSQNPSLGPHAALIPGNNNDPLPASSGVATGDLLPATSSQTLPTSSTHTDSSSALNLNMSFNNSIPPWVNLLLAVTKCSEGDQQRNLLLLANQYLQEATFSQPVAIATSSDDAMMGQSSQLVPDVAANVSVVSDVPPTLQSFIQAQGNTFQQVTQAAIATTSSDSLVQFSSPPPLTSPLNSSTSPPPPLLQPQPTQVYGSATPHLSLPTSNITMSSTAIVTSSATCGSTINPSPLLCSHSQMSQVPTIKSEHSPTCNSLSTCESPPPSNTFQVNKSPSVSPIAQFSPSQYTPSPSSSSLSPPSSPRHQTPPTAQSPTKLPESSNTSLPSVNVFTCTTQPPASLKLKRSKSHSAPVRHLAPSPLRKTQSSSPPKSYSLVQKFNSSLNDDSSTAGARSSSVSPTNTFSPSQSNSSDCCSPPEQPSKPQNQSPPTRLESSVTFRYSSSPSPSNTPPAPYTPSSIPLLSPVAARLLFLSTGTQLPSSPPEDVDKLPPIINRKPISSSRSSLDTLKKEGHGCTTNLALVQKKEPSSSTQSSLSNNAEKRHHSEKKKRRGSSLAKSMELVPTSTDVTTDSFFTSTQVTAASVTTPTHVPPPQLTPQLTSLPQVVASNSCVTTPSPVDPPPMLCTPLPLRRNSCDAFRKEESSSSIPTCTTAAAMVSPTATTTANLWAPKSQPQLINHQPVTTSHVCSPEQLLSNILKMTSSSKSLTSVSPQSLSSTLVPGKGSNVSSTPLVPAHGSALSTCTAQGPTLPLSPQYPTLSTSIALATAHTSNLSTAQVPIQRPTSSTLLVSTPSAGQSVPPRASTTAVPTKALVSSYGPTLSSPSIANGPTSYNVLVPSQSSTLPTAAAVKKSTLSSGSAPNLSQSKATLPIWSNSSRLCSSVQSMSSSPVSSPAVSSSKIGPSQLKEALLTHLSSTVPSVVLNASTRVSKAQCALSAAPPQSSTMLPQVSLSSAQNVPQKICHNKVTSPILSAVLSNTSTRMSTAQCSFPTPNAMQAQASLSSVQQNVPQYFSSDGITSPVLSSAHSTGAPAVPTSYFDTSASHTPNHPVPAAAAVTTVTAASIMPTSTTQSSVQNSIATHHSTCSTHLNSSTVTSPMSSSEGTDLSSIVSASLLPEGLEHRVISGLLQAGPPMTLNKIHGSVQKHETSEAANVSSSGGYGVVTTGGVTRVDNMVVSSASCDHRPRMKSSSSGSDSNPPLLSPVPVNSSKQMNTSPPYAKSVITNQSNPQLVATKPSPPSLSSTPHSVVVTRPSTLHVSSTQAISSVLPSPIAAAASTNQLPSLNSGRNYSLNLPLDSSSASQAGMAAVNGGNMNHDINSFLSSECVGSLVTSPSQLLSPSSLLSPPGSTTLPDPLKTFIFPISLSPPIERRQLSSSLAQNGVSAFQNVVTPEQQRQQKQLPVQSSLKSPDHRQRNSLMLPTNQQQSRPLLSPTQQRSSPVLQPDPQKCGPLLFPTQQRSSPVLASDMQRSGASFSASQQRSSPVLQPKPQRSGPPSQQKSSPVLAPNPQRNDLSFSASQQRSSPVIVPSSQRNVSPKQQQRISPVVVPNVQKNSWDMVQNEQRRNSLVLSSPDLQGNSTAPSHQRGTTILSPNSQRSSAVLPSNDKKSHIVSPSSQLKSLTVSSANQRSSPVLSLNQNQRSSMGLPQVNCHGIPPSGNKNGPLLSPAAGMANYSMASSTQQRGNDMFSPISQMTGPTCMPSASPQRSNSYSPVNSHGKLPDNKKSSTLLSPTFQVSKPMQFSDQRRNSPVLASASQMNSHNLPPGNNDGNTLHSPTVYTSCPVPFSNQQASSAVLSTNSLMSSHGTPSDKTHLLSPTFQGNSSMLSYNQQKSSNVSRRSSSSSDQPRSGTVLSQQLQRSGPPLSQKPQRVGPVVVPNAQRKTTGKSSGNKKKSKHRLLSPNHQKKGTIQSPNNQGSGNIPSCNNQATPLSTNQRSNTTLLPNLNSQRSGSVVSLDHQRSSPVLSHELQRSNAVPSNNQRSITAAPLPSYQRNSPVVHPGGSSPLLSPDYLESFSIPSLSSRGNTVTVSAPNSQKTSTVLPLSPSLSSEHQRSNAFPLSSNERYNVATSLPNTQRNDAALSLAFPPDQRSYAVPSSNHQVAVGPTTPATVSRHRASPALVNAQQKSSSRNPPSLNMNSSDIGLASTPRRNSPTLLTVNGLVSAVHPAPVTIGNGLSSATSTVTTGNAIPQSNSITNSNGLAPTPYHHMSNPAVASPVLRHPPTSQVSLSLQQEVPLPQNGSVSSISPSWDTDSLSLLSDIFAPQPSQQRQRHHSASSVLKYPQTSVVLPSMGGDQLINELLANSQTQNSMPNHPQTSVSLNSQTQNSMPNHPQTSVSLNSQTQNSMSNHPQTSVSLNSQTQNSMPNHPQTSVSLNSQTQNSMSNHQPSASLPSMGGDGYSVINGLLANSQNQNSIPNYPQTSVNLPRMSGNQVELLATTRNPSISQSTSKKQSVVRPQSGVSGQRSNSSMTHPLMQQISSPSTNGPSPWQGLLPQQQQNGQLSWQNQNYSLQTQPLAQQLNCPLSQQQQNSALPQHQRQQNGPLLQQRQNGPTSQQRQNGPLLQQQQNGQLSQNGTMLWQQQDLLSSHSKPCPPHHAAVSCPSANSSGLVQPISLDVSQSLQLGGLQVSPPSSTLSQSQGHQQQLLSPTQTGLPSLPKLTPLPSQPPRLGSYQALPTVSTPQGQVPATTGIQQMTQFGGCVPPTRPQDNLMQKSTPLSVVTPQPSTNTQSSGVESSSTAQSSSLNLLSILNSLSPSQLESLLNTSIRENQPSSVPLGNGRQGPHSHVQQAVPHSQTALTNFQNQNFGSPIPSNLPLSHSPPATTSYRESLAPHSIHHAKPKVTQVNKTATSAPIPQFTVRSSCTSAELRGQLLQLEPAAVMGCNTRGLIGSNATAGSVSALRLHSGQMN